PWPLQTVLVIGLGNREITPDALGPKTTENILATRHISPELARSLGVNLRCRVAVLSPGVLGQTGVEAGEVILGISSKIEPDAIIVIDALASKSVSRLFNTLQISNTGITPGSGVGNSRFEISEKTLKKPVISIGVPTVVTAHTFKDEENNELDMIVTPSAVDRLINDAAKLIGLSVNRALQPFLSFEELQYLT
ncbi:MAG: GPR endopeptidase, partial [Clostridiales bacterium]|nr:GPR endopeptidase [Candidatus Equinaster intestinalis]